MNVQSLSTSVEKLMDVECLEDNCPLKRKAGREIDGSHLVKKIKVEIDQSQELWFSSDCGKSIIFSTLVNRSNCSWDREDVVDTKQVKSVSLVCKSWNKIADRFRLDLVNQGKSIGQIWNSQRHTEFLEYRSDERVLKSIINLFRLFKVRVQRLNLSRSQNFVVNPNCMELLAPLKHLRALDISGPSSIGIDDLKFLPNQLEELYMGNGVYIKNLDSIMGLTNLSHLNLRGSDPRDEALNGISKLTTLRKLNIARFGGRYSINSMKSLGQIAMLTNLTSLDLSSQQEIPSLEFCQLSSLINLKTLVVENTNISDEGLASLAGLTNLKKLSLSSTKTSAEGIAKFKMAATQVTVDS